MMDQIPVIKTYGTMTFSTLPNEVQLYIFSKLECEKDKCNARLVCSKWLLMINFIIKPHGIIKNDEELQLVRQSYFNTIHQLVIANQSNPLPIYSSSRRSFPDTNILILEIGNSTENILKIFRYYSKASKQLLLMGCFGSFPVSSFGPRNGFNFENIVSFEFVTTIDTETHVAQQYNHVLCICALLKSVHFKSLKSVTAYVSYALCLDTAINQIEFVSDKVNSSFKKFVFHHRFQIQTMNLDLSGNLAIPIIKPLKYVRKSLKNLEILFIKAENINSFPEILSRFVKKLSCLQRLEQFKVATSPWTLDEVRNPPLTTVLNKFNSSLESFVYFGIIGTIDFLYSIQFVCLKHLQLGLVALDSLNFQTATATNYQITTLSSMNLNLCHGTSLLDEELMKEALDWIIQIGPNIKYLRIGAGNIYDTTVNGQPPVFNFETSHVQNLIHKLMHLKELRLFDESWTEKPEEFLISNWVDETNGITGAWITSERFYTTNSQLKLSRFSKEAKIKKYYGYSIKIYVKPQINTNSGRSTGFFGFLANIYNRLRSPFS